MTKISVSKDSLNKIKLQDKTNWNNLYNKPQAVIDQAARNDKENPVLSSKAKYKKFNP